MIGFYNYTMVLTYMSLLSASLGIITALSGDGHPYLGIFFLLFCGLCDAFDGKVARTKKDRTERENKFGIQVDSLSDLVAFGVLPCAIGVAKFNTSEFFGSLNQRKLAYGITIAILLLYVLAAMIRLAYFNVTEEERQRTEDGSRKYYIGLPVTSAAIIFPAMALIQCLLPTIDLSLAYFVVMGLTAIAFISNIKVKKPGLCAILGMVGIGIVEFIIMLVIKGR